MSAILAAMKKAFGMDGEKKKTTKERMLTPMERGRILVDVEVDVSKNNDWVEMHPDTAKCIPRVDGSQSLEEPEKEDGRITTLRGTRVFGAGTQFDGDYLTGSLITVYRSNPELEKKIADQEDAVTALEGRREATPASIRRARDKLEALKVERSADSETRKVVKVLGDDSLLVRKPFSMTPEEGEEMPFETRSFEPYLYDGDPILLKGRMGLRYLAKVSLNEDVPVGKISMNENMRKNLKVKTNDLVTAVGHYRSTGDMLTHTVSELEVAVVEDTIQGIAKNKRDIMEKILVPYFSEFDDDWRPCTKDSLLKIQKYGKDIIFKVTAVKTMRFVGQEEIADEGNDQFGMVKLGGAEGTRTKLSLASEMISADEAEEFLNRIGYSDIGGLGDQLAQIRELVELVSSFLGVRGGGGGRER